MQKTLLVSLSLAFACASTVATFSPAVSVALAAEDAKAPAVAPAAAEKTAAPAATPEKAAKKKADAKTSAKKKTAEPPAKKDPKMVNATFKTNMGDIKIAFNKEKAPLSVAQFEMLIKEGFYSGIIFHRVIPGFMIQAGGMEATMAERTKIKKTDEKNIAKIPSEASNGLKNTRGTIALARTNDPNSASSQFFVNLKDNGFLDKGPGSDGYTVIGEVTAGMDVVDKIAAVPTGTVGGHGDVPKQTVIIESATID